MLIDILCRALWSGFSTTTFGFGILTLLNVRTSTIQWVFINLIVSAGVGIVYPGLQFGILSACQERDSAPAMSVYCFCRGLGSTLGMAVGGVILQNQLLVKIRAYPNLAAQAEEYSKDASAQAELLRTMTGSANKTNLVQAYADSLKVVWTVMCVAAGVGLRLSCFIEHSPLDSSGEKGAETEMQTEAVNNDKDIGSNVEEKKFPIDEG